MTHVLLAVLKSLCSATLPGAMLLPGSYPVWSLAREVASKTTASTETRWAVRMRNLAGRVTCMVLWAATSCDQAV